MSRWADAGPSADKEPLSSLAGALDSNERLLMHDAPMQPAKTVVYVVTEDPIETKRITEFLSVRGQDVISFRSATEYITSERDNRIACVLLDLNPSDISGLEVQSRMTADGGPPVIFVTAHGDIVSVVRALKNGAVDMLTRPVDYTQLVAAVETAFMQDWMNRKARIEISSLLQHWASLTPRERDVFQYTVAGLLNKQAAAELGITENTYQVHRGRVMRKMQADSLAGLVRMSTKLESILQQEQDHGPIACPVKNSRPWLQHIVSRKGQINAA
jgi:FixJ family two-component response regulator